MKLAFSLFLIFCTFNAYASNECSGEMVVPSLTCLNPRGADVRLYIMEYQTCQNGKIAELDRTVLGMNVISNRHVDDIHTINEESMTIKFAENRQLIDASNRVDDLTFLMPKEVKMIDGETSIEMNITEKTEADYEGAGTFHFKGSFKIIKADGVISNSGKLICFVDR